MVPPAPRPTAPLPATVAVPLDAAVRAVEGNSPPERALRDLACGVADEPCELADSLAHIGSTLEGVITQTVWLRSQPDHVCALYGPFLGRSLLELILTAILSRTDPFRVLVLREMQRNSKDDIGIRRKSAIQWQGDILAKKKPPDLWSSDLAFEDVSRALLGDHADHVLWRSAFTKLADLPQGGGGDWLAKTRNTHPDSQIPRLRAEVSRLYSSLSKGLHHEFVIPPAAQYDRATVFALIQDVLDSASTLALATHMLGHIAFRLDPPRALRCYERIQELRFP